MGTARKLSLLGLEPPGAGAARTEQLTFIRNLQLRALIPSAVVFILVVVLVGKTWAIAVVGCTVLWLVADVAYLTLRLRRGGSG